RKEEWLLKIVPLTLLPPCKSVGEILGWIVGAGLRKLWGRACIVYKDSPQGQTFTSRLSCFLFRSSRTDTFAFNSTTSCSRSPHRRAPRAPRRADRARPRPTRNFHSTLLRLTLAARWPYISGQKKAGL